MMNKKASSQPEKIASITLIIIVLLIVALFLPKNIMSAGKNFFNKIWGNEEIIIDAGEADAKAQDSFAPLLQGIESCGSTKTPTPCLCSVNLNGFYSYYALLLKKEEVELVNVKGETPLHVKSGKSRSVNCYITDEGEVEMVGEIFFETLEKPYLDKGPYVNPDDDSLTQYFRKKEHEKFPMNPRNDNLAKTSSGLCWVHKETAVVEGKAVSSLKKCE
jgi:hypothetical protein